MIQKNEMKSITWAKVQRYRLIEWLLLWERKLNISTLMEVFSISRVIASKDLNSYIKLHPKNISDYQNREKYYQPTHNFKPYYTTEDPDEYYSISKQINKNNSCVNSTILCQIPIIKRHIFPGVVSAILNAIQEGNAVEIKYCSASFPKGRTRIIHPHRIISASGRYHVRAYCEERKNYRDFNLSRILENVCYVKKSIRNESDDAQWNKAITLILGINNRLPVEAGNLIANEFMIKSELKIETNAALINYLLIDNNIPSSKAEEENASPWQYPLVIKNRNDVSEDLWDSQRIG